MKYLWTTIYVKNMEESIAFYGDLCGLQVSKRFPAGSEKEIAFMSNGADNETLVELLADSSYSRVYHSEFITLGFAVDSMESMLDMVKNKNIPVHSGPFETPGFKCFGIKDPNGLHIQFFQQK